MSIYATWLSIDDSDHTTGCEKYEFLCENTGQGWPEDAAMLTDDRYYRATDKRCTCENKAPIIYKGSHVNPADDDPRGGSIDVAAIPNFLHPKVRFTRFKDPDNIEDDMCFPVEFLRLSVHEDPETYHGGQPGYASLVLDRPQVEKLRDTLTGWLDTKERW